MSYQANTSALLVCVFTSLFKNLRGNYSKMTSAFVHENPISCDPHVSNRSLFFANFHLACVAWKYKWAQEGRARDTRRLIFTEYETILHDTTNHDILPCKNSEQFKDSRKASK